MQVKHAKMHRVQSTSGSALYQVPVLECILVLLQCRPSDAKMFWSDTLGLSIYKQSFGLIKTIGKYLKPILIGKTENIAEGDDVYNKTTNEVYSKIDKETLQLINEQSFRTDGDKCFKIIAQSEQIPFDSLLEIVDGILKDNDNVFVECDMENERWLGDGETGPHNQWDYFIKYDNKNEVIIHKVPLDEEMIPVSAIEGIIKQFLDHAVVADGNPSLIKDKLKIWVAQNIQNMFGYKSK